MGKIWYKSPMAIHPWETLKENLEELNISQKDLALRSSMTEETISRIIHWKAPITFESALKFERVLWISRDFWIKFQEGYDKDLLRLKEEKKLKNESIYLDKFSCYLELAKMWFVKVTRNKIEKVEELLRFFAVESLSLVKKTEEIAYRKSTQKKINQESLAAWLRIWEIEANKIEVKNYDEKKLKTNLERLRLLTNERAEIFSEKLKDICVECWVIVIYTPALKNTLVNGSTRWINNNPVIQLSLRWAYADTFWFTFFHEIWHILKHLKKSKKWFFVDIDNDEKCITEEEADIFSQKTLIPDEKDFKNKFVNLDNLAQKIEQYSNAIKIDKWIVAWRLAKETGDWSKFARFRTRLQFIDKK